ncbi:MULTISPECIES: molybdopterin-dependent oxidoreductase [Halomonas]|uniref:molybdopterin-dependent oxidoreductase n=1 Tax=Halomonas TaxID=2745 RepID=UPI001CD3ED5D|nr:MULTISPECIES: molybdopterin-dependent oxidoreductase [Halomonas]MCA0918695.1 molybdopterin-dependent oxidoreductase [Halomonas denitrificans]
MQRQQGWCSKAVLTWRLIPLVMLLLVTVPALALESPQERVILTLSGQLTSPNVDEEAHFDARMLESLPQHDVTTGNPWIDGQSRFSGPLLRDVLAAAGAEGSELRVIAIKDYESLIPAEDAEQHDVILAMRRDGEPMRIRDKGPLFVVYPFDDEPELKTNIYFSRSVWQVARIEVR